MYLLDENTVVDASPTCAYLNSQTSFFVATLTLTKMIDIFFGEIC